MKQGLYPCRKLLGITRDHTAVCAGRWFPDDHENLLLRILLANLLAEFDGHIPVAAGIDHNEVIRTWTAAASRLL